ncbi:hypothetical protein EWM64_g7686 [Hericium alpestre]|uniref:Uncharacterized protein n=1 Tax=Hericium alpestre TaxID=135208 RepID=A0A4Y9ZN81_9AGAM|nr:hypothetical protein EWM64_g7686 [Hericium alpestre]
MLTPTIHGGESEQASFFRIPSSPAPEPDTLPDQSPALGDNPLLPTTVPWIDSPQAAAVTPSPTTMALSHDPTVLAAATLEQQSLPVDDTVTAPDTIIPSGPAIFSSFWATTSSSNIALATAHELAPDILFGINWEFFAAIRISLPTFTEGRLIQALERNPHLASKELVRLMLRLGM